MDTEEYEQAIGCFRKSKILVVGDLMLDHYIHGHVERISAEAPVPVVAEMERSYLLGGAGNVAANIASLGARVALACIVGDDKEVGIAKTLCASQGVTPKFVVDDTRATTLKTRIMAERHQLLRIDRESSKQIASKVEARFIDMLRKAGDYDLVVISDYAKGCLTEKVVDFIKKHFGKGHVVVGAKPQHAGLYRGVFAVVLNLHEGEAITGIRAESVQAAHKAAQALSRFFSASIVLTRGEYGMTILDKHTKKVAHVPTKALRVYDVTGAGDTALAAIALMLSVGADLHHAAEIGNIAAGIVVGIEKTATTNVDAIMNALKSL